MSSPCQDCPHRKLTCHDRCDEYMAYHDALVAAKEALRVADDAIGMLKENYIRRKNHWKRGNHRL